MRTSTRSSRHPNGSTERAHRDSGDAPRCARVALPVFWMSMTQLEPPPSLNSPFRSTHTRAAKQCESPETTPRNERACKFGTSYDSRRQICPRTRHVLFVKKMSLASLARISFAKLRMDGPASKRKPTSSGHFGQRADSAHTSVRLIALTKLRKDGSRRLGARGGGTTQKAGPRCVCGWLSVWLRVWLSVPVSELVYSECAACPSSGWQLTKCSPNAHRRPLEAPAPTCTYMHTWTRVRMLDIHTCSIHACMHACIHTYIHTHVHCRRTVR